MTYQTDFNRSLGGSLAGASIARLRALTLAAILAICGVSASWGQAQPDAAKPAKPAAEKKSVAEPQAKTAGHYLVHQSIDVGGRYAAVTGSAPMWATLFNLSSGGRVLGQSLEMHSSDTSKTPLFDSLSSSSTGYGGDPIDVTRMKVSKGRFYDLNASFRRDRQYFDYNLLDNSLLTTYTAAAPVLVQEPDSLHIFNTVRRNSDLNLTVLPLYPVSFRFAFNHGTHEGPSYSTVHNGGDIQVLNWFSNAQDTYSGGVDVRLARRTTLSYDQFYILYRGDSAFRLTGANYTVANANGPFVSLGVDVLAGTTTCGSAATKNSSGQIITPATTGPEFSNGSVNQYCAGTLSQTQTAPIRTSFPTEQLRFSSHYFDKVSFNGRLLYTGATGTIDSFNDTFNGLDRSRNRQTVETGAGPNGQFAKNRRIGADGDFAVVAELNKYISLSDAFNFRNFRNEGFSMNSTQSWTGTAGTVASGVTTVPATGLLTPITDPSITIKTAAVTGTGYLNQKTETNTLLVTATPIPEIRLSGGWRYRNREIADSGPDDLTWHENGALLGVVVQPSRAFRLNLNYEGMSSKSATAATLSDSFTREAPNKVFHLRMRATAAPAKWIDVSFTGNDYEAKNDDPLVNHAEHNHDLSLGATVRPMDGLSLDFSYSHDDVFSITDLCYIFVVNANAPLPAGAVGSTGACLQTAANPQGTLPTTAVNSQLYLGHGFYDAPSGFFAGSLSYSRRFFRFNGGLRQNNLSGTAEQLNPLAVPGALQSKMVTPFADMEVNIAQGWAWHGNWLHDEYYEKGPAGSLPSRNVRGNVMTLGVKYAF